jgi:hypothetical protein
VGINKVNQPKVKSFFVVWTRRGRKIFFVNLKRKVVEPGNGRNEIRGHLASFFSKVDNKKPGNAYPKLRKVKVDSDKARVEWNTGVEFVFGARDGEPGKERRAILKEKEFTPDNRYTAKRAGQKARPTQYRQRGKAGSGDFLFRMTSRFVFVVRALPHYFV